MILVTRLGGRSKFWLNENLIEFVEETPDTVVSMATGRKLVVAESAAELNRKIAANAKADKTAAAITTVINNEGIEFPRINPPDFMECDEADGDSQRSDDK